MPFGDSLKLVRKPHPRRWTALELVTATIPEPECFLEPICARETITLLAGRRSAGKTYFTLHWAGQIALGGRLGWLSCKRAKVLYLSQEMSESAIRRRLARLYTTAQLKELGDRLIIICREKFTLDTDEGADFLAEIIEQVKPDVVFIDSLRKVKGSYKESDNDEMGELLDRLEYRVAVEKKVNIVLIHHFGKPREDGFASARGASAIEDVCSDIIYLSDPKDGSNKRNGLFEKTRDGGDLQDQSFEYEFFDDDDSNTMQVLVQGGNALNEDEEMNRAEEYLKKKGPVLQDDLVKAMSWGDGRTSRRRLLRLVTLHKAKKISAKKAGLSEDGRVNAYGPYLQSELL